MRFVWLRVFVMSRAALILLAAGSTAAVQDAAVGAGKLELGLFPMGGTFFVGGDDNKEVDFNVYTSGANISYYVNERTAIEGELTISFGWAQDIFVNSNSDAPAFFAKAKARGGHRVYFGVIFTAKQK